MDSTMRPIVFFVLTLLTILLWFASAFFVGGLILLLAGAVVRLACGTVPALLVFNGHNLLLFGLAVMLLRILFCRNN